MSPARDHLTQSEVDDLFSGRRPSLINHDIDDSQPFGPEDFTRPPAYKWSDDQWKIIEECFALTGPQSTTTVDPQSVNGTPSSSIYDDTAGDLRLFTTEES